MNQGWPARHTVGKTSYRVGNSLLIPAPRIETLACLVLLLLSCSSDSALSFQRDGADRGNRVARLSRRKWEVRAERLTGELEIDGWVREADWSRAEPITDFYQRERNEGLPATEETEVRVLYDDTHLYIAFVCKDSQPERMEARAMFRDESAGADDLVSVMIDSYHDQRSAVQLVTNANGLIEDLLQAGETTASRNMNWDMVWKAEGRRTVVGWEVEISIPFQSLRFRPPAPGEEALFGIGFKRNIPRKNEEVYWPFVGNDSSWYRPAELGLLRGLREIRAGRSLEFRPYVLGGFNREVSNPAEGRFEAGLDAKWGITSGLTADFTINTDFAQEEADVQQINFTRFSLFFPEKRQFFLEGQRSFDFGLPREADLVFARRIGLGARGEPIPILGGARLSGRQGPYSIGAMSLQTGAGDDDLPGENFSVFRLRRDIFSRSSIGALVTNRSSESGFNRVLGADASFFFRRNWLLEGFAAQVWEDGSTEDSRALYGRFAYNSDRLGWFYRHLDLGENFRPGIGFVRRPGSREQQSEIRFSPRPGWESLRQFHLRSSLRYITDQENFLQSRERNFMVSADLETGDSLTFTYSNRLESIVEPFELRSDVEIVPGAYRFDTYRIALNTFRRRHRRGSFSYQWGGFWHGNRRELAWDSTWRLNRHLDLSGSYSGNWIDLPEASFTTHLVSSRIQYAFRNDLSLLSLLQYNSTTRQFSSNIRFNWIPKPGTDFFIVYNELDDTTGGLQTKNRSLSVKLNYSFSF